MNRTKNPNTCQQPRGFLFKRRAAGLPRFPHGNGSLGSGSTFSAVRKSALILGMTGRAHKGVATAEGTSIWSLANRFNAWSAIRKIQTRGLKGQNEISIEIRVSPVVKGMYCWAGGL